MTYAAALALLLEAARGADLSAAASASSRPPLCAPSGAPSSAWDVLRTPDLDQFCLELAQGSVRLATDPTGVKKGARKLAQSWPGRPEPWLLLARAGVQLGEYAEAFRSFGEAQQRGQDLNGPGGALHPYAIAAAMTGHWEIALASYRRLIPLASLWPDPLQAQRAYLEAAVAALALGPDTLAEARGYVAMAKAQATSSGLRAFAAGLEALIGERQGQPPVNAEGIADGEVWHLARRVQSEQLPESWPVVPRHVILAAASLLIEPHSAHEALQLWDAYVQGLAHARTSAPIEARARERLRGLKLRAGGD